MPQGPASVALRISASVINIVRQGPLWRVADGPIAIGSAARQD